MANVLRKVQEKVNTVRQCTASNKRMHRYGARLLKDKDERRFDDRVYDQLRDLGVSDLYLVDEKQYADSVGFAQSIYRYAKMEEQMRRFQAIGAPNRRYNRHYQRAFKSMLADARKCKLRTFKYRSRSDIEEGLPKKDTHAGFSYFLTGWRIKGEYLDDLADNLIPRMNQAIQDGTFGTPIIPGTRTQGSGLYDENGNRTGTFKDKTRFVSIVDIYVIMAEVMYAKPYQAYLARVDWYAGGKDDTQIQILVRRGVNAGYHILTIDYSNYDQSIPYWLIEDAFEIVRASFDDLEFNDDLFNVIVHDFIHKVFLDGHGNLVYANKGVPSGSMFTQIIDSIVNRLMILTYKYSRCDHIEKMIIMGDDNIIFSKQKIDKEDLASYLTHMFGITVNSAKCSETEPGGDPEFLSRVWREAGVYRDPKELFVKLIFPERFREYDRKGFKPIQVILSYIDAYPLGMRELLGPDVVARLNTKRRVEGIDIREVSRHAMSGFAYYRANYCMAK